MATQVTRAPRRRAPETGRNPSLIGMPSRASKRRVSARRLEEVSATAVELKPPMDVTIRYHGIMASAALNAYIQERINTKLGKFAEHLSNVTVRLEEKSGPTHQPVHDCTIKVLLKGTQPVIIDARDPHYHAAVDEALARTFLAIEKVVRKRHDKKVHPRR